MSKDKKGTTLSGVRVSDKSADEFVRALKHYHVSRPDFCRMCIDRLIEHYQADDPLVLPLEFNLDLRAKLKSTRRRLRM